MGGRGTREVRRAIAIGSMGPSKFGILCDNVFSERPDFLVSKERTRVFDIRGFHAHPNQVVDYDCSIKFICDCVSELDAFCTEPPVTFQIVLRPLLFQAAFCLSMCYGFRANSSDPAQLLDCHQLFCFARRGGVPLDPFE